MTNSIFTIHVYKHGKQWVFDDVLRGLDKEALVGGTDAIIDKLVGKKKEVTIVFSDIAFPGHTLTCVKATEDLQGPVGTYYYCNELGMQFWLCPALLKFFDTPPEMFYAAYTV